MSYFKSNFPCVPPRKLGELQTTGTYETFSGCISRASPMATVNSGAPGNVDSNNDIYPLSSTYSMPGAVLPASHVLIPRWPLTTTRARRGRITSKVTQIITITGRRTQLNPHGLGSRAHAIHHHAPHLSAETETY